MNYDDILGYNPREILFKLVEKYSTFDANNVTRERVVIGQAASSAIHNRNSVVTISPGPGSGLVNPVTVYYNRLAFENLGTVTGKIDRWPLFVEDDDPYVNVSDLLPVLESTYGIVLAARDIIDAPIDKSEYPYQVGVVASAGNQAWTGTFWLAVNSGRRDLNNIILNNDMTEMRYLSDETDKVQGPLISYSWFLPASVLNWSTDSNLLVDGYQLVDITDVDVIALIDAMNTAGLGFEEIILAGDAQWEINATPSALNLFGAKVINNPDTEADFDFALRTDAVYRTILELSDTCTSIGGIITLYATDA